MNTEADLDQQLRGKLVQPDDPEYDEARSVYNGMIDKEPWAIAYCVDAADVMSAVKYGHENNIRTSIRGGGHSASGMGVCDDGLVIDLSNIDFVYVDPDNETVRVGGGATWGQVDHATHAFGMATPGGFISTTGVGGLTLGGGLGHLSRKYGLSIDNLIEAKMVLADGSFVTASDEQNSDLFWAIRGGGGNFGVVTSFKFQLHPVNMVYAGPMLWEMEDAEEVAKLYRDFILNAPRELNGFLAFMNIPPVPPFPEELHHKTMCAVIWCFTGPQDQAEEVLEPVRNVGNPAFDGLHTLPFPALQSVLDDLYPAGLQWYWKADYVKEISDDAIQEHLKFASEIPTMRSFMHLYPIDGAVHDVRPNETAYYYRDANWSQLMCGVSPEPEDADTIRQWTRDYWEALHPYSAGGAYVNFMMEEGDERVKATYRDNYDDLAEIKAKYDPDNFFRINQNIEPA